MAPRNLGIAQLGTAAIVKPTMIVLSRPDRRGMANIPTTGGVIIAANHVSHADPLVLAHAVWDAGRWPVFLAKASLFHTPIVGPVMRSVDQTPVDRGTVDAAKSIEAAVASVRAGKCVIVYPEGTTTKEPDLWPMRGKTGVARLWLTTGAPVIPVAMDGPQRLFDPRTHKLRLMPRTPVTLAVGEPVDLSQWQGAAPTVATLQEITDRIMTVIRDMLAQIRGVATPPPLWSPRQARAARQEAAQQEAAQQEAARQEAAQHEAPQPEAGDRDAGGQEPGGAQP